MNTLNVNYRSTTTQIYIHPYGEIVSDHMRNTSSFFEIDFLNYIYENHNKQSHILDIGANIGNHSLFFSKFLDCKMVHCFEPFKSNLTLLEMNATDKCKIYPIALSNIIGKLPLYNSQEHNFGGFSLHSYKNNSSFLVKDNIDVITLDSLNLQNVSMIKIDVENHENEVLDGARQTILQNRPILFIENLFHGYPNVCENPNPHFEILNELNYYRKEINIKSSFMDLWVPI